jgi:hypothetical protein
VLVEIEPRIRARVDRLVEQVGEAEFRRGVAEMTRYHIDTLSLDDVVALYVLARQGRVHPPQAGRRAAELHQTLPGRTSDDAGFSDEHGQRISREEWLASRTARLASSAIA